MFLLRKEPWALLVMKGKNTGLRDVELEVLITLRGGNICEATSFH
jgi:hypothetical protein